MSLLVLQNIFAFIVILSVIVFIHEFGHYYIAKKCGVKIEEFSIGFGKELFFWTDKNGTRWKVCALPFGGFVKLFGDENPASAPDLEKLKKMTPQDKKKAFYFKNVYQRFAIVLAGPLFNFILAILIFAMIARVNGITYFIPQVDEVISGSVAEEAGIKVGDIILEVNGNQIEHFEDVKTSLNLSTQDSADIVLSRDGEYLEITLEPKIADEKDIFGNDVKSHMIGIISNTIEYKKVNSIESIAYATKTTYSICINTLKALGQIIVGDRSLTELGGPLKIAQYSGQSLQQGLGVFFWFIAMLSANLGLVNLLPIPLVDGGHLSFFIVEMIKGKPISPKIQCIAFQIGFYFIIGLMVFATINDIVGFFI